MSFIDVLPENWSKMFEYRRRVLHYDTLKNGNNVRFMVEECMGCEGVRVFETTHWTALRCIFDKCIKQYPHRIDNKEFK